ncbi:hypothetical protein, partial [Aeromonas caviae]|uniref:hypothetical protein n=1 Tax=Aeromonas caviae TaxID=648 RepID=UPI001FC7E225
LPIRHVSQLTGVGWHTIKEIDKRRLQTSVGTIELGEVLNERFNPALHAPGEAGARGEPVDMFTDATTAQTV